ncbi:MAG: hypothetical protein HOP18_13715 [Deltaproteobacteria bacterium]|nr:hypothetical protein [Deltaproteobacteria bacterium]
MTATRTTAAPTGRNKPAQGKERSDAALGHESQNTLSPEGAEEMGSRYHVELPNLPAAWSYQRFENILDIQGGSQPPKSTFVYESTPGYIQLLQIRDFGERGVPTFVREDSVTKRCTEDDILIARYGASLGRIVTGEDGAYNVALAKVIFDKEQFFNRYLFYLLQTPFFQTPIHMISRSAQNGFNKGDLSDILLPVAPLPKQRRIVAEIEKQFTRLEAGVAALRRVQANLKRYRAAVLKAACEGRLVPTEAELVRLKPETRNLNPEFETGEALLVRILAERRQNWQGRGQFKEPAVTDTTKLAQLPEGWTWATLDALGEIKGGITKDQNRKHTAPARSVPYLRVANVQRGYIDLTEVKEIVTTEDEIQALALKPGDILFNEGGDRDKLGRGWVWNGELPECIHQNHVFRARLYVAALSPKLVSWYANTFGQQFFFDEGKHTTNLASISMTKLKGLPVPIPPPAEQTRIVAEVERRLSVVEELEAVVSANLQRATRLRQSILQKAFTGEL